MSAVQQKGRAAAVAPPQRATAPVPRSVAPQPRRAAPPARELGGNHARAGPLPAALQRRLSPALGEAAVRAARVHTGPEADAIAARHRARAVAVGEHVFFGEGQYRPGTPEGDLLIAHEVAHVGQALRGELSAPAAQGVNAPATAASAAEQAANDGARQAAGEPAAAQGGAAGDSGAPGAAVAARGAGKAGKDGESTGGKSGVDAGEGRAPAKGEARPGEGLQLEPEAPEAREGGKAPEPDGDATAAYLQAMEAPPSRMVSMWTTTGTQASSALVKQQKALDATLPTLSAKLDGAGTKAVETVKPVKPEPKAGEATEIAPGQRPAALPAPAPTAAPPVTHNSQASKKLAAASGQDPAALQQGGAKLIADLGTGADVETDPGPPPPVPLTEGADPARAADAQRDSGEAAEKARTGAADAIVKGPGPAQVQPAKIGVDHTVPPSAPGAMPGLPPVPGMDQVTGWKLDPKAAAAFDSKARPKMSEHLAQSKAELGKAETQRKTDRGAAVEDGKKKVAEANDQADRNQAKRVGEVRGQIVGEQKDTLQKQSDAVEGLKKDTAGQKKETLDAVDGRVKGDQKKIGEDYKQAHTDAQAEHKKSEAEARAEKDKASRDSKDKSWWERAVDFVKDAIDKIAKAIDGILSALKKAVGAILDKVKKAALELIDKARAWINDKLDQFGKWLKKAVTAVLGDLFPGLTRKINAFIDKKIAEAKAAVNAVADGLKKAVSALVDGLKKALDKIIDGFRAAVKAAAALAKALVSGDWAAVAQMLLEGILALLGIDPAEFYAFIAKIRGTLGKIVDAPGAFVGHLIDAVMKGFRQFTDKILDYLKAGILQWLFGAVAEAGITLPKKFDVAGVLDLVLQVLGLTKARLRAKAVKLIGEKNVERIELVWQFISAAIEGGLSGLWEKLKEFLGGLWDMVVGGAQEWLVTTLVKKAIIKLVSLFNPLGAIIQLILTAWDVYQWVRDNARRIAELVRAVVDSLAEIAAGAIGKAAGWIEAALGKLVPIAINLLANVIGLGGIGERIKEIIAGIQATVDKAIDSLIGKVLGFFKGVFGKKGEPGEAADADVPKVLAEPAPARIEQPSPALMQALAGAKSGQVLYQAAETDPKAVTQKLLSQHANAKFDRSSGTLTLPPLDPGELSGATTLAALGAAVAKETGVSRVTLQARDTGFALQGSINPYLSLATLAAGPPVKGQLPLYRGLHFENKWKDDDYNRKLNEDLVSHREFSAAARQIVGSKVPDLSDVPRADLEAAATLVREKIDSTKDPASVRGWWRQAREFDSFFYPLLQRFVNTKKKFAAELESLAGRPDFAKLEFTVTPFISTSKNAPHAAAYAVGEKGTDPGDRRTSGVVGRLYAYLFTVDQLAGEQAIDVRDLANDRKVSIKIRHLAEEEVTFVGSIPSENLADQVDANAGDSSRKVADSAVKAGKAKATSGWLDWETR
jgi:hypothetical protein